MLRRVLATSVRALIKVGAVKGRRLAKALLARAELFKKGRTKIARSSRVRVKNAPARRGSIPMASARSKRPASALSGQSSRSAKAARVRHSAGAPAMREANAQGSASHRRVASDVPRDLLRPDLREVVHSAAGSRRRGARLGARALEGREVAPDHVLRSLDAASLARVRIGERAASARVSAVPGALSEADRRAKSAVPARNSVASAKAGQPSGRVAKNPLAGGLVAHPRAVHPPAVHPRAVDSAKSPAAFARTSVPVQIAPFRNGRNHGLRNSSPSDSPES